MSNYFRDFMQPAKVIFERLQQKNNKRIVINGKDGTHDGGTVIPPYFPDLPEYPCKIVRDINGKVTEVQYGESSRGYVWREILVRGGDGKLLKIIQENPDGSFDIALHRNIGSGKVELVDIE